MKTRTIAGLLSGLALAACGNDPAASDNGGAAGTPGTAPTSTGGASGHEARRICDSSSDIRLAFSYVSRGSVRAYTSSLSDLGSDFLYISGTCQYWIQQPSLPHDEYWGWRSYREGELTSAQEEMLHEAVGYDDVSEGPLAKVCSGLQNADQSTARLWDGRHSRRCDAQLNVPENWPYRDVLFARAKPMQGAIRVQIGIDAVPRDAPVYAWPLKDPIENYLADNDGQSARIDPVADAEALREVRDRAIADAMTSPGFFYGVINVEPSGYVRAVPDESFVMSLRDELPFTDDDGLWSPP